MSELGYSDSSHSLEKQPAFLAYVMARGIYGNNAMLERGEEPTNRHGDPLCVQYRGDVADYVQETYGDSEAVVAAIEKAYSEVYPKIIKEE
jgi:hypothetical protein